LKIRIRTYWRRLRNHLLIPLVAFLCLSLVSTGCLFWVDNSWAYVRGGESESLVQVDLLDGGLDYDEIQEFDPDGDGIIPVAGGYLIRGNGDRDDNREEPFVLSRLAGEIVRPRTFKAVTSFGERRTVAAYKDFGHLKVMPAGDGNLVKTYILLSGYPCCARG